jgi:8-oxo-dGTP pyrophosphatase MutT (NUDIX family)
VIVEFEKILRKLYIRVNSYHTVIYETKMNPESALEESTDNISDIKPEQTKRETTYWRITRTTIEENCNCAGVFIVKDGGQTPHVLLVESKRKNYQYSFPKGKRNKGESTLDAAKRELYEETGLAEEDYEIFPEKWYVEHRSDTGKPHIVYYMAHLKNYEAILNPIDTKEIISARWFTPEEIYAMRRSFYLQRRQITTRAIRDYRMRQLISLVK